MSLDRDDDTPTPKKRRKPCPATMLSLRHLRADGWIAEKVEYRESTGGRGFGMTHDFLGFIDIIAIRGRETLAVQTTSASNVASRTRKIAESPYVGAVREAGWGIVVHGWWQEKPGARWVLKVDRDLS